MLRSKILQMRVEHAKEQIDIIGWLRNFENPFVCLLISECDSQGQFFCDEIEGTQTHCELLQKTADHEKKWLGCFNFVLKFKALFERLRRSNQLKQSIGLPVCAFPHLDCFGAKTRAK